MRLESDLAVVEFILKSTLKELNSFAVRLTSLLWMSVLTSLRINLRLLLIKPRIMLNLLASFACVVFYLGLAPTFEVESLTPQLSCEIAAVPLNACWAKSCKQMKMAKQRTSTYISDSGWSLDLSLVGASTSSRSAL